MKNTIITLAALLGAIAVSAYVLSASSPVNADSVVGYVSVLSLIAVAVLEYRVNWRRLLDR